MEATLATKPVETLIQDNAKRDFEPIKLSLPQETGSALPSELADYDDSTLWGKLQNLAELICSRESTYRAALDITGWEIPALIAAATRNVNNFLEALFEVGIASGMLYFAPVFTSWMSKIAGSFILDKDEQKDIEKYMLYQTNELDDTESMAKAKSRIIDEEVNDIRFLGKLYSKNPTKVKECSDRANSITEFFKDFKPSDQLRQKIKKLQEATILGESFVESTVWGGLGMITRLFRKFVLKQEEFTGTQSYLNKKDSKKLGNTGKLGMQEVLGTALAAISGPIINKFFLNQVAKPGKAENSSFWSMIKNQWTFTHGKFPKLGLLFSYLQVPVIIGRFTTAQGSFELIERILETLAVVPSWWFGHRATNGTLAKKADIYLAQKYNVEPGILVEPQDLNQAMPEPAKIQHILDRTQGNPALEKEARKLHAKVLYKGFALHSLLVLGIRLIINWITKLRVKFALNKNKAV